MGTNVGDGSSHDSSSDSDRVSPQFEGPNIEAEKGLPSVVSGGGGLVQGAPGGKDSTPHTHTPHTHTCTRVCHNPVLASSCR